MAMDGRTNQSSYSSSRIIRKCYDVFVSFKGTDTRNNFTDHLFGALQRKGIDTFRDDTKLKKGESIAPELLQAIEGSHVFVVVFSKNYGFSTWCLRELTKILDCVQVSGKRVLPIFYDVDPSEVRKQSGNYEKAFAKHEENYKNDLEKIVEVKRWKEALIQVANLSGWDVRDKLQYAEIEKIVEEILNILDYKGLRTDIVGMHSLKKELENDLTLGSTDWVRVVGIWGMGGMGKTTLATSLYDKISHQYDACCFIDDVSKLYQYSGPIGVQNEILHQILKEEKLHLNNPNNAASLIESRLHHVRTLVVLDNVDKFEQLKKIVVNRERLGAGSRIIIISRDMHILKMYGVEVIYTVPLLNWDDSILLFCRNAFKSDDIMKGYEVLTHDFVEYTNGVPLAIKLLGTHLFGRGVSYWSSSLARLRQNPSKDIMGVLQLNFKGLEEMEKEIFLDIACFFNKCDEQYVKNILNCCGFQPNIGLEVLINKSLISIRNDNKIEMHDILKDLGRNFVINNSSKERGKWSRLWQHIHFDNVMFENMIVEAIVLTESNHEEMKILMAETLSKLSHLRLLILKGVKFSGSLDCLADELKYVEWYEYPFTHLPSSFKPYQLFELILERSSIKQLWEGKKYLPSLRTLDLRHSEKLIKMPNFEEIPNLERLNLEGCVKLVQVDQSIGLLRKLFYLNLKDCKSLVSLPNTILGLNSLEYLNFSGCSKVFNNPMHPEYLKKLDTSEIMLHHRSTSSILKWITLPAHFLYPKAYKYSSSASYLLPSLAGFSFLRELDISFCGLSQIPDAIGSISCLELLNLRGNNYVRLPSLKDLSRLVYLNLEHCKQLKFLPELPSSTNVPLRRPLYWKLYTSGLYVFNCPNLGEREYCSSMTFSWMIQVIQANQESFVPFDEIDIVIPGSEIPRWFHNQYVGSSITIDPSSIMHDDNCIGLACYVVFLTHDDPTTLRNEMEPSIGIGFKHKSRGICGIYSNIQLLLVRDLVMDESDHVWLLYFTRKKYIDLMGEMNHGMYDFDGIKLATFIEEGHGLHLEVKNCGYRWVFKQDLELLNLTMMHNGISLAPERKFFVIEDNSQP